MIGAKQDLYSIKKQFISVDELLKIFADCEGITIEESAQWFAINLNILRRSVRLVLKNDHTLVEYEYDDHNFYNCPIKTIELIADGEEVFFPDYVGFSRYLILMILKELGLDVDDDLINNSRPYISQKCYEQDDNFYKSQCAYLISMIDQKSEQELPIIQEKNLNHIYLLNPYNQNYVAAYALLLRVHHDLNTVGRFEGTKQKRIEMCLEEYGHLYAYQNTSTNVLHLSNLIKVRTSAKDEASKVITKIFSQEQK